jgi:hypothetical protein
MENNDNDAKKKWKKLIIEWKNVGEKMYAKEKFK